MFLDIYIVYKKLNKYGVKMKQVSEKNAFSIKEFNKYWNSLTITNDYIFCKRGFSRGIPLNGAGEEEGSREKKPHASE